MLKRTPFLEYIVPAACLVAITFFLTPSPFGVLINSIMLLLYVGLLFFFVQLLAIAIPLLRNATVWSLAVHILIVSLVALIAVGFNEVIVSRSNASAKYGDLWIAENGHLTTFGFVHHYGYYFAHGLVAVALYLAVKRWKETDSGNV
jgi:hypothetical protein